MSEVDKVMMMMMMIVDVDARESAFQGEKGDREVIGLSLSEFLHWVALYCSGTVSFIYSICSIYLFYPSHPSHLCLFVLFHREELIAML